MIFTVWKLIADAAILESHRQRISKYPSEVFLSGVSAAALKRVVNAAKAAADLLALEGQT